MSFPDIQIRKTKIKATIVCEYEIADVGDVDQVREDIESALGTLRQYGSAEITYETDAREIDVPAQKVRGKRMPK